MTWTPELRASINKILALPRPVIGMYLVCTRRGQPYTSDGFRSIWHRAMKKALEETRLQLPFTEHDLRAFTGTAADASGIDAQELLGHTNKRTTSVYLRSKLPQTIKPLK